MLTDTRVWLGAVLTQQPWAPLVWSCLILTISAAVSTWWWWLTTIDYLIPEDATGGEVDRGQVIRIGLLARRAYVEAGTDQLEEYANNSTFDETAP